jgi:ribosomal protein S18 acetylase RimI-like enzyme
VSIELIELDPDETLGRIEEIRTIYRAAFHFENDEPDDVAGFVALHTSRPGFRCIVAEGDDCVIGFGYGFTGRPGQPWRDQLAAAMEPDITAEWLDGHFEFAEFAVRPDRQRDGVGSAIYAALVAGLENDRGVLTVIAHNAPAIAFYQNLGWQVLHRGFVACGGHGPYLVMGVRW